jgi:acetyl esterase/lipase
MGMEMVINVDVATLQVPAPVDISFGIAAPPTANLFVPPLPISKTCAYKTVGEGVGVGVDIAVDVYLPASASASTASASIKSGTAKSKSKGSESGNGMGDLHPIMLFIHGGAWLGSNRSDYCRPLFHQFLQLGFVVTSMDYRLRPETSLDGQLEDVRDMEGWLRGEGGLGKVLSEMGRDGNGIGNLVDVDTESIVVVGASAGAHLALLTVGISFSVDSYSSLPVPLPNCKCEHPKIGQEEILQLTHITA